MKKLSKLIITQMNIREIPCCVCAYEEDGKVMELRFEPVGEKSSLGNIYVGQIENIAANIGAVYLARPVKQRPQRIPRRSKWWKPRSSSNLRISGVPA